MNRDDSENPPPWSILLGRHGYGMTPENETAWAWAFMAFGFAGGVAFALAVFDVLATVLP